VLVAGEEETNEGLGTWLRAAAAGLGVTTRRDEADREGECSDGRPSRGCWAQRELTRMGLLLGRPLVTHFFENFFFYFPFSSLISYLSSSCGKRNAM
jgi:hypothetical protein